jgi:hypothetical protein
MCFSNDIQSLIIFQILIKVEWMYMLPWREQNTKEKNPFLSYLQTSVCIGFEIFWLYCQAKTTLNFSNHTAFKEI